MGLDDKILEGQKAAEQQFKAAGINEGDQILIRELLNYGLRTPDRWGTKESLGRKLNPEDPEKGTKTVERILKKLSVKLKKLNITLEEDFSNIYSSPVFSINYEEKSGILKHLPIFNQPSQPITALYIADPGFGQVLHDRRSDKGANYFLKFNNLLKELDVALVMGAVPWVPEQSNEINTQYLKLLGKKTSDTQFPDDEEELPLEDQDYFRKHVKNKITTLTEAIESGAESLESILGRTFRGDVKLFFGYQDRKNLKDKRKLLRANYRELQKDKEKVEDKTDRLEEEYSLQESKYSATKQSYEFVKGLQKHLKQVKDSDKLEEKIKEYFSTEEQTLTLIRSNSPELHQKIVQKSGSAKNSQTLKDLTDYLASETDKAKTKLDKTESKLQDARSESANLEKNLKNFRLHKFLDQINVKADKDAIHHFKAMNEYLLEVSQLWKKWKGKTDEINPERRSDEEIKGHLFRVEPQINSLSDSVGLNTIQKQMLFLREDPSRPIPNYYVSAHDAGGVRIIPQMQKREGIREEKYFSDHEIVLHLKLPTMQSEDALEYCRRNEIDKPWDVKRKTKGSYASGIVITHETEEGILEVYWASTKDLTRLGRKAKQYEELKEELKKIEDVGEKKKTKKRLTNLENAFKVEPVYNGVKEDTIKIAFFEDWHVGSPNVMGRLRNLDIAKGVIQYSQERVPDIVVLGELAHGNHVAGSFKSDKQDIGLLPHEIEKVNQEIYTDTTITPEQKLRLSMYFSSMNRSSQPMTSASKQLLEVADGGLIELAQNALDAGGLAILVSGNHYDCSNNQSHDEAEMLELCFDRVYRKSGQLWVLDGSGERDGRGEVPLDQLVNERAKKSGFDYGSVYAAHSFKGASDPILGMMSGTNKMGLEVRAVLGAHVHQTAFGFADGKSYHIAPGLQTTNKFVEVINQTGGFRGAMVVELSRNENLKDYRKISWIPQKYLEKHYLTEETWAHKLIVEKYIPQAKGRKGLINKD